MGLNAIRYVRQWGLWSLLLYIGWPVQLNGLDPQRHITTYRNQVWNQQSVPKIPDNSILTIVQDREGLIWLRSPRGILSFDGLAFSMLEDWGDEPEAHAKAWAICPHPKEGVWLAYEESIIHHCPNRPMRKYTRGDGLVGSNPECIFVDREGTLWVATQSAVNRLVGERFHSLRIEGVLGEYRLKAMVQSDDGMIWCGSENHGLLRIDPSLSEPRIERMGHEGLTIEVMGIDPKGELWLGTYQGLYKGSFAQPKRVERVQSMPPTKIMDFLWDSDGAMWVATVGDGLYRLRGEGVEHMTTADGLNSNALRCLLEDSEGILWVGTNGSGLAALSDSTFINYSVHHGLPASGVLSAFKDSQNRVWTGAFGQGAYYKAGERFVSMGTRQGLSSDNVSTFAEFPKGTLWIGTFGGGVNRLMRDGVDWFNGQNGGCDDFVNVLCAQEEQGLWVGTGSNGVFRWNGEQFRKVLDVHSMVISLLYSQQKDLWVGTQTLGVYRLRGNEVTHFGKREGLINTEIYTLAQDPEGRVWVGTQGGGLAWFDGKGFRSITQNEGLADNFILALFFHRGDVWCVSFDTIYRFSYDNLREHIRDSRVAIVSERFGVEDGLMVCEGTGAPPACVDAEGTLYFSTLGGLVALNPEKMYPNSHAPRLKIKQIRSKEQRWSEFPCELPAGVSDIEIHYQGLNYHNPHQIGFQYRLVGYDTTWHEVDNRNVAFYTNLPPQTYSFELIARNSHGVASQTPVMISFTIRPYFYRHILFQVLWVFLILLLLLVINKVKSMRHESKRIELARLVEQRTAELADSYLKLEAKSQALQEATQIANRANRAKSDFLARMSHEIKTPLNSVIGFSDLLKETPLNHEQQEYTETISRSGEILLGLLDDVLDFSKIEAGEMKLEHADFDLHAICYEVCEMLSIKALAKSLDLLCYLDEGVPLWVRGDAKRFRQVVINLLSNAIKFTPQGEIELSVSVQERKESAILIHTTVRDTGIGVPEEKEEAIFDVFQQADESTTRQYGGSGLGLSISRQIALEMNGQLWVEPNPQGGSLFHFTARLEQASAGVPRGEGDRLARPVNLLLVTANRRNQEILSHYLTQAGGLVTVLSSVGAIEKTLFDAAEAGRLFSLCLLDTRMPGLSKEEVVEQVVRQRRLRADFPIVVLISINDQHLDRLRAQGVTTFITQPVRRNRLIETVNRSLRDDRSPVELESVGVESAHVLPKPSRGIRVLLVEDNEVNQRLASLMLERLGHRVSVAGHGKEAVERLLAQPSAYDLVFMDVQMPVMDGRAATLIIRESGLKLPIIAMTAASMPEDRQQCLEVGMNDVVTKPIKPETVARAIEHWCQTNPEK